LINIKKSQGLIFFLKVKAFLTCHIYLQIDMKFFGKTGFVAIALFLFTACSQSKWSEEEEEKWMKNCRETFVNHATSEDEKMQLEDLCDCMLKVTSRKYTAEEAQHLTEDQERKLLNDCNYSY
jgi:hypothetical protein